MFGLAVDILLPVAVGIMVFVVVLVIRGGLTLLGATIKTAGWLLLGGVRLIVLLVRFAGRGVAAIYWRIRT